MNYRMSLQFSARDSLNCELRGDGRITKFYISTSSSATSFKDENRVIFATINRSKSPHTVEIPGIIKINDKGLNFKLEEFAEAGASSEQERYSRVFSLLEFLHLTDAWWPGQEIEHWGWEALLLED